MLPIVLLALIASPTILVLVVLAEENISSSAAKVVESTAALLGQKTTILKSIADQIVPLSKEIPQCQCGRHTNRDKEMQLFWKKGAAAVESVRFKGWSSLLPSGSLMELRVDAHVLSAGYSSSVFHAEIITQREEEDGRESRQCVAMKITMAQDHDEVVKEWTILEAFDKLPDQRARSHVINMLAYGEYHSGKERKKAGLVQENVVPEEETLYLFTILELGQRDFMDHLEQLKNVWKADGTEMSEQMLQGEILPVVLVARDMHQKIMHLDFKPANLLFVGEVLKAIDFGNSQLIEESVPDELRNNFCKLFDYSNPMYTATYEILEHWQQCRANKGMKLSTKSDIWAIGIIIYEIAMLCPGNNEWEQAKLTKYQVLDQISKLYMLERVEDFQNLLMSSTRLVLEALKQMLRMELKFPRISRLLIAIFDHQPARRPIANGILHYLKGNCHLDNTALEQANFSTKFLPGLSISELKQLLTKKRTAVRLNLQLLRKQEAKKIAVDLVKTATAESGENASAIRRMLVLLDTQSKEIRQILQMLDKVIKIRIKQKSEVLDGADDVLLPIDKEYCSA